MGIALLSYSLYYDGLESNLSVSEVFLLCLQKQMLSGVKYPTTIEGTRKRQGKKLNYEQA